MIIDFHTHCFTDEVAHRAIPLLSERSGLKPSTDGTKAGLLRSMDQSGVAISVILPIATKAPQTPTINDWVLSMDDKRIIPFGTIHPDYANWEHELLRLYGAGIRGIKLHPDYQVFYVDDPKMFPLYEKMQELGMIALFHAGEDIGLKPPYHCTPRRLLNLLEAFPSLTVVAAHMGGYRQMDDVLELLCGENLYFDTCFSDHVIGDEGMARIIEAHGADRILFGTDLPWDDQAEQIKMIHRLPLSDEEREKILWRNAVELLQLKQS